MTSAPKGPSLTGQTSRLKGRGCLLSGTLLHNEGRLKPTGGLVPTAAVAARSLTGEAITAVDWPLLPWEEGHLRWLSAASAGNVIHLAWRKPASSTCRTALLRSPLLATRRAPFRVLVPPTRVELLIFGGKGEVTTTLNTRQCHFLIRH